MVTLTSKNKNSSKGTPLLSDIKPMALALGFFLVATFLQAQTSTPSAKPTAPAKPLDLGLTKKPSVKPKTIPVETELDATAVEKAKAPDNFPVHCMTKYDRSYKRGEAGYADCMMENKERQNYERAMRDRQQVPRPGGGN